MLGPARLPGSHIRRTTGFTLLEMLVVVAVIALIAGIAAVSVASAGRQNRTRSTVLGVLDGLALARLQALRSGVGVGVEVRAVGDSLVLEASPLQIRRFDAADLTLADELPVPRQSLRARFGSSGRTDARSWRLLESRGSSGGETLRIWEIRFDPLSGAPSLAPRERDDRPKEFPR